MNREDQATLNAFKNDGIVVDKVELTTDEVTVLMIAAAGEPMMPIGRWEQPTESLVAKGYLKPHPSAQDPIGRFNCRITEAGREALGIEDRENNKAFATALNKIGSAQTDMINEVVAAAAALNRAVEIAMKTTGDSRKVASQKILSLLREKMTGLLNE